MSRRGPGHRCISSPKSDRDEFGYRAAPARGRAGGKETAMPHQDPYHPIDRRRRFLVGGVAVAGALTGLRDSAAGPMAEPRGARAHDVRASGAVGDGIADDTAAIQVAIDTVAASG